MKVFLDIMHSSTGHRTVIFDASNEEGGQGLEREVAELVGKGATVLVTINGENLPVVSFDSLNNAWLTRDNRAFALVPQTRATAIQPLVGG